MAFGAAHGVPWLVVWRNWYAGHALGMIIVAPFLISVTSQRVAARCVSGSGCRRLRRFVALFVAVGICAAYFRPVIFVIAPAILFVTVRFGLIGATLATFVTALIASGFVVIGIGQPLLSQPELSERILACRSFSPSPRSGRCRRRRLLTERDRLLGDLSRANSQLTAESERKSHLVVGLRRHLSMAEEKERLRLSHELHDQAGQSLIAAILELNEIDH